ncbi:Rho GTPase activation protein [Fimicolochytrium jonesii]|uniref:Rho GTPase activation protein n=1 Tax=Fimicolochytrium jonesii TaxID=1396493 RepID=UPI0022FEEFA7|nr:Rho GTPase activation protein [Fimicolochytrium jonesii]KAI8820528.1 Rho GTPase activation protein [Fimicolochytrium jonesii]
MPVVVGQPAWEGGASSPGALSASLVLPTTDRDASSRKRHLSWSNNGEYPQAPLSIPQRVESRDPLNAKSYAELTPRELTMLQQAAFARLNAIFKHYKMKPMPGAMLDTIAAETTGGTSKSSRKLFFWNKSRSKDADYIPKENETPSITNTYLVRSLDTASAARDSNQRNGKTLQIPVLIHECVAFLRRNGLQATGVFRVNGSERRMGQLFASFNTPPDYGRAESLDGYSVYDVAGVLKKYLRSIPEPLLTRELYPQFIKCLDIPAEGGTRIRAFRLLIMLLPAAHLVLLETLLDLFKEILANSSYNQMSAHSIARIISPNILRPRESNSKKQGLEEYERGTYILEYLIQNEQHLRITNWSVQPFQILDIGYYQIIPQESMGISTLPRQGSSERLRQKTEPARRSARDFEVVLPGPELADYPTHHEDQENVVASGTRIRRVKTVPSKRSRATPTIDPAPVELPHTASSQSLQDLQHYRRKHTYASHKLVKPTPPPIEPPQLQRRAMTVASTPSKSSLGSASLRRQILVPPRMEEWEVVNAQLLGAEIKSRRY